LLLLGTLVMAVVLGFVSVAWAQDTTQQQAPSNKSAQPSKDSASAGNSKGHDDATGYRGSWKQKQLRKPSAVDRGPTTPSVSPQAIQTVPLQRAMGAYIKNVWTDPPTYITNFNMMVGQPMHAVHYFQNWGQADKKYFDPVKMDAAANSAPGAIPMVTWASRDATPGADQRPYKDRKIVAGNFDSYIKQWADAARDWGKPMFLRFDHEMNGTWFSWSPGVNGNTSADFIAAWKHVHHIFVQEGATNVMWVWSPYVSCGGCSSFSSVYPSGQDTNGKDYVDWIALDGYNWGTSQSGSTWQTAATIFKPSYDSLTTKIAPGKPFMIAETSSAEKGGSKAKWITDLYASAIPNSMPLTQAVVWFSSDKTADGETDWRVDSSTGPTGSLTAYQTVANETAWQGYVP
jgi:beta-mannanase